MSADFSKRHSLLMFSGGIDSLFTLYQLLHDTDDVVWAHHVNLINREGRHPAEAKACSDIVSYLTQRVRAFRYTESTIDHRAFQMFGRDVLMVAFEAGLVVQNAHAFYHRGFDRWLLGYCKEESEEVLASGAAAGSTNRRGLTESAVELGAHPFVPPKLFRQALLPKQAQIEAMPPELVQLAWTCRQPTWHERTATECGVCKTCKLMHPIRADLAAKGYPLVSPTLTVDAD
jgi:hypothetical protein